MKALAGGERIEETGSTKIICMKIMGEVYGVKIDYVEELIKITDENLSLSGEIPHVRGVISVRGELVPIIDLSIMLELKKPEEKEDIIGKKGVIVKIDDQGTFCIVADSFSILTDVSEKAMSSSPKVGIKYADLISGVIRDEKSEEKLIVVLDPIKILQKHRELSGIEAKEEEEEEETEG